MMQYRIKELRKHLHMTQIQFGERIGVKGNTVTGYETGLRNPTDAVVKSICREFGASETWLRTGEGEMFVESPDNVVDAVAEKLDLNDFERMILSAYVQLPKQLRDEFCKCMREGLFKGNPVLTLKKSAPDEAEADNVLHCESVAKSGRNTPFDVGERRGQEMHAELERISSEDPDDSEDGGI